MHGLKSNFRTWLIESKAWWSPQRLDYVVGNCFRELVLANKSVLEIGAGSGLFSVWCAAQGASRVVALEPGMAGSTQGGKEQFEQLSQQLRLPRGLVMYRPTTLQEFHRSYDGPRFDYVLAYNTINHLDEKATPYLHDPQAADARSSYVDLFGQIRSLLCDGGAFIASDVSSQNVWHDIGLTCPFGPTIEWHKHQPPEVWISLLAKAGFEEIKVFWNTFYRLRWLRFILSHRVASYFISSHFTLRCRPRRSSGGSKE